MPDNGEILTAQVVLFSPQGRSISGEGQVTTRNINALVPAADTVKKATILLQGVGFVCNPSYPTLSISGPRSLYEKVFNLSFEEKKYRTLTYMSPLKRPDIPPLLKDVVTDIVFGEPVEPFV